MYRPSGAWLLQKAFGLDKSWLTPFKYFRRFIKQVFKLADLYRSKFQRQRVSRDQERPAAGRAQLLPEVDFDSGLTLVVEYVSSPLVNQL